MGSLLLPYALFAYCGLVLSPLIYWARLARRRPRVCALRFAIAIFGYLLLLSWAIEFALVRLRIYSQAEAIRNLGPLLALFPTFSAVIAYFFMHRMLSTATGKEF